MLKLIDANIILRYLLNDHPLMSEKAKDVINEGAFTLNEVICEVVYVLKGVYTIKRDIIANVLKEFINEIAIEHKQVILEALTIFSETSFDFVDCILIARNRVLGDAIVSFDKKLCKMLR